MTAQTWRTTCCFILPESQSIATCWCSPGFGTVLDQFNVLAVPASLTALGLPRACCSTTPVAGPWQSKTRSSLGSLKHPPASPASCQDTWPGTLLRGRKRASAGQLGEVRAPGQRAPGPPRWEPVTGALGQVYISTPGCLFLVLTFRFFKNNTPKALKKNKRTPIL